MVGNAKVGSQEIPGVTGKFGLGVQKEAEQWKASRVLPKEHTGHSKHPPPTKQKKTVHMAITRWSTLKLDWLYSLQPKMEKLYIVSKIKIGSWLWLRSWTPYCFKFRLKLKKVGRTTRPFSYDLNQIPYDYTVEVTNRLKGLDLIDRVHEKQWQEVPDIVQKAVMMTIPKKKTCKKAKCLSEEALQIAKNSKRQTRKGKTSICMQSFKEQQGKIRKPY